jgi:hypothetical protein
MREDWSEGGGRRKRAVGWGLSYVVIALTDHGSTPQLEGPLRLFGETKKFPAGIVVSPLLPPPPRASLLAIPTFRVLSLAAKLKVTVPLAHQIVGLPNAHGFPRSSKESRRSEDQT